MTGDQGSGAVSPTAHYTGETWVRSGLSHPELATWQGRALHRALVLPIAASRTLGGPTLDGLLLARHRIIDSTGFKQARLHRGDEHPAAVGLRGDPGASVICVIEATGNDVVGGASSMKTG